jgi:hypothetical protein
MNATDHGSILAASQSFYFVPAATRSTSVWAGTTTQSNDTNPQASRACDTSMLTTLLKPPPHPDVLTIVLMSMTAVLILMGIATLFLNLRRPFPCRRIKDSQMNPDEADYPPSLPPGSTPRLRSTNIIPFWSIRSSHQTPPSPSLNQMHTPTSASKPRFPPSVGHRDTVPPPEYEIHPS